jgi:preprotein translocase subunit YajC
MIKSLGLMGIFVLGMWILLIAPQRKKAKELEATLKSLKAGDKVVTSGGILGVVLSIKDRTLSIRSADTKLEVLKSSVLEVLERGGEPSETKS